VKEAGAIPPAPEPLTVSVWETRHRGPIFPFRVRSSNLASCAGARSSRAPDIGALKRLVFICRFSRLSPRRRAIFWSKDSPPSSTILPEHRWTRPVKRGRCVSTQMATYKEIQNYVRLRHAFVPKTCWIADVKGGFGLTERQAPNRRSSARREVPCPADKRPAIEDALRHFRMI
jgi:hypothetical protein